MPTPNDVLTDHQALDDAVLKEFEMSYVQHICNGPAASTDRSKKCR